MMDADFIRENFESRLLSDGRYLFEPTTKSEAPSYRYFMLFIKAERRFILSRQLIQKHKSVDDDDQIAAFKKTLPPEYIAECMRAAMAHKPDEDDIPF